MAAEDDLIPPTRQARLLVATASASFAAIALAYLLAPPDPWTRALIADLSWTWSAAYAVVCCAIAWRRIPQRHERSTWLWLGAGCAVFLAGQLAGNYYELLRRVQPPYPSLADVGHLGIYPCFFIAVVRLLGSEPRRRLDAESMLDNLLVTFITAALAFEFLLEPLLTAGGSALAVTTSIAWSVGGIAVLWMILIQMLQRTRLPLATAGLVIPGLAAISVANVAYASLALRGTFRAGGPLDLGWDAGLLVIATAAALAPERSVSPATALPTISGYAARNVAVLAGLLGTMALAVSGSLQSQPDLDTAILSAIGIAIIAIRVVYSLRADRRYAELLEREVADQTRSLMDSLAATASAERNLRLLMRALPEVIVVLDRSGRILEFSPGDWDLPPGMAEKLPGRSVFEFLDPGPARIARENLAAAFRGEVCRFEIPFRRRGGQHTAAAVYAPVREGDRVTKVIALGRDITDQLRTAAQLQQAEKLAAMGQLVSGVAHEINNPAAIISGFAQTMLLDDLKPDHRDMVKMIHAEATRIGRITQNLLAFARAGGTERTLVDLNDIVRRTFALRSYHLSTLNIAVTLDLDNQDPKVWANGAELQQLFLNLLINAEQALTTFERNRAIAIRTVATETEVRLEVADSGPGIPVDIRGKIFDPFFTTKPEGMGTGLGLSICYGIVQEHSGRIWVQSEEGNGATFSVALPRDPRKAARAQPGSPQEPALAGGPLSVLIVDDEAGLRNALLRFLGRRGIQARGVGEGREALDILRHETFDVIISDVRMPGMGGREFLDQLRRDHPELVPRLILSTGDSFAPETAALLKEAGVPTLIKPFDFTTLEQGIRKVAASRYARATRGSGPD